MKKTDIFFALGGGILIGFLVSDFLKEWGIHLGLLASIIFWIGFPLFSLLCLWLAYIINKKITFILQIAKFLLVGSSATAIDLKLFEFLVWISLFAFVLPAFILKGISFVITTAIKYCGNKYWTFQKNDKKGMHIEIAKLIIMDTVALLLNVLAFYFFDKMLGPQFRLSISLWTKLSVILAALAAATFTFLGYKFFVFRVKNIEIKTNGN